MLKSQAGTNRHDLNQRGAFMLASKWIVTALCVAVLCATAAAGTMPGVADVQKISFDSPIRVGATLLPQGDYEIRHVMEGSNHIMVFRNINRKKAPEVRIQCTLVPMAQKAERTEKIYTVNAAKEEVLQELVFQGDTSKHVFEAR
jgi:acyl-CoA hydrolase